MLTPTWNVKLAPSETVPPAGCERSCGTGKTRSVNWRLRTAPNSLEMRTEYCPPSLICAAANVIVLLVASGTSVLPWNHSKTSGSLPPTPTEIVAGAPKFTDIVRGRSLMIFGAEYTATSALALVTDPKEFVTTTK